jgi:hypothetical protein
MRAIDCEHKHTEDGDLSMHCSGIPQQPLHSHPRTTTGLVAHVPECTYRTLKYTLSNFSGSPNPLLPAQQQVSFGGLYAVGLLAIQVPFTALWQGHMLNSLDCKTHIFDPNCHLPQLFQ